jgi:hypothetical protein
MLTNLTKNSTSKHLLSDKNLYRFENELLNYSGIPRKDINIKMVKVDEFEGKDVFMRTFIYGNEGTSLKK